MITQRTLAKRLGLTQSSVSLALRGHSSIPAATRRRVERLAAETGYRRDLLVSGLALRRWSTPIGGLAYLGCEVAGGDPAGDDYWQAVRGRCRHLGLNLQYVPPTRRQDVHLGAMLENAGVRGLVVGQDTREQPGWRVDWARFAVVHCGLYAVPESGDVIAADLFAAVAGACRAMQCRGYQRIAVLMPTRTWAMSEQLLAAAMVALERSLGDPRRLAVWVGRATERERMYAWLRRRRPQAVLGYGDGMLEELKRAGFNLPFAALACGERRVAAAGMVVPFQAIGSEAVDLLVEKLRHGAVGQVSGRRIHLVAMPWRDGDSLPNDTIGVDASPPT
jgi:DNA-binding LacI/PurR family transcriptional regulator